MMLLGLTRGDLCSTSKTSGAQLVRVEVLVLGSDARANTYLTAIPLSTESSLG